MSEPMTEKRIAQAICCPNGCLWQCFIDTTDYQASKIQIQARAVLALSNNENDIEGKA